MMGTAEKPPAPLASKNHSADFAQEVFQRFPYLE